MSKRKILLRFDDICPTMNWEQWEKAKQLLDKNKAVALLGVIPDCKDPDLLIDNPREDFWEYVKGLQSQGYTIAMHGYQHVFELGHSEFAGLSYETQLEKISKGKYILESHGIETNVFFAPAHNFDENTLRALSKCGFKYLSDGFSCRPYCKHGIILLPCRTGGVPYIKNQKGHITAVIHAHEWVKPKKYIEWEKLELLLTKYSNDVVSFSVFCNWRNGHVLTQRITEYLYLLIHRKVRSKLSYIKRLFLKRND